MQTAFSARLVRHVTAMHQELRGAFVIKNLDNVCAEMDLRDEDVTNVMSSTMDIRIAENVLAILLEASP